jgi:hypothetical protein
MPNPGLRSRARSLVERATARGRRTLLDAPFDLAYRIERRHQAGAERPLDPLGERIVADLRDGHAAVVPLDELDLASTAAMECTAEDLLERLAEEEPGLDTNGLPPAQLIWMASQVPELRAWATEPRLTAIVQRYLEVPPALQGVHARVELVNEGQVVTELWHRDIEDRRMLKCFVFPDEVTLAHGPFEYLPDACIDRRTRRDVRRAIQRAGGTGAMGLTDPEMAALVGDAGWQALTVPARSAVFVDPTACFHHSRPRTQQRRAMFFVWTSAYPLRPEYCTQYWDDRFPPAPTL